MGLRGLARRAGAARGAYMAELEDYHRNRQAMLDQRQAKLDQSLMDWRRQQMGIAEAGERRTQAEFDQRQADHKNYTIPYYQARQKGLDLANEVAAAKLDDHDTVVDRQNQLWDMRQGALRRMTQPERDQYLLGIGAYGKSSGRQGSGTGKPPISDTLLKANAEAVTPDRMKMAFDRKFYDTDAKIEARTGMKRDQFIRTLADQYRAHILSAREKAMTEDDFIRQAAGKYGFWDRDDLGRLMTSMNDARSKNPTKHGFGWFGFGRRNAEEEYARRNPAFYKQQKALIEEISGIKGINPELKNQALRNPVFVRNYRMAVEKGLSPDKAFLYGAEAVRRGAR